MPSATWTTLGVFSRWHGWLSIVATAALLAACATLAPPPAPVVSPNDDKAYRYLQLGNRMQVLLVSDPSTDKAAASLDVHVGSANNPPGRGGLAHFLEHMLFLGTDKYPDSGEYARFISEHGGSRNAYTGFEHTNYFFDIDQAHLAPALDRFGQFFISPRFDAEYVEREVNAVHAEYNMGLNTDPRRTLDVLREVVNPAHPFSILGVGTADTLADRPGQPVREDLLRFYRRYYSANLMALVVLGRDSLDDLEALVRGIFSAVPNRNTQLPPIDVPLYTPGSLPMVVHIRPQASLRQLELSFPIPDYSAIYRSKPVHYIANLIGHEGEGSLLSLLRAEGWARELSAGAMLGYRGGGAFGVTISLTEAGMAARAQVLAKFFEYVALLRRQGPQRALYEEQGELAALDFLFLPETQPLNYVAALANDLHQFQPRDVLRGNYIMDDFRPDVIADLLATHITPDNMAVSVVGEGVPTDRQSEYYATSYSVQAPAPDLPWRVAVQTIDPRLHLPAPNPFVPEDVSLVDIGEDAADAALPPTPRLVKDADGTRVWFHQNRQFRVPQGAMYVGFRTGAVGGTPARAAATRLLAALLRDALNEYTYPALLAGLDFSLGANRRGLDLKLSGYDDKQLVLLRKIVNSIAAADFAADFSATRFDNIRTALVRELENIRSDRAYRQVAGRARQFLLSDQWSEQELIAALNALTPADVQAQAARLWASARLDILLNGNYEPEIVQRVERALAPLTARQREPLATRVQVVRLAPNTDQVHSMQADNADAVLFWYLQAPGNSVRQRALAALTGQVVRADYFEELRTEQQLGYVVSAFYWPQHQVPGLVFMVQSPVASAAAIREATLAFLRGLRGAGLGAEQFERHRAALLVDILEPHKNIGEQSAHFWRQIAEGELGFDSREQLASALRDLTLPEWRQWFDRTLFDQRAALALVSPGGKVSPGEKVSPGAKGVLPPGVAAPDRDSFKATQGAYEKP